MVTDEGTVAAAVLLLVRVTMTGLFEIAFSFTLPAAVCEPPVIVPGDIVSTTIPSG